MKLENISKLDEDIEVGIQYLVIENLLSDLIATGIAKFQTYAAARDKVAEKLNLSNYIAFAKDMDSSLLDDTPEADKWWKSAVNAINKKHGGLATAQERMELISKVKNKISPSVNRDLENTETRLANFYAQKTGNDNTNQLFDILFGNAPKTKKKRRHAYAEGVQTEDLVGSISNALDMLDPKKRVLKGAALIRASHNAKIATLAISLLSLGLDTINTNRKSRKRPSQQTPSQQTPLQKKYEMAMFINRCMVNASKQDNEGKDRKYWLGRIRDKARRMGMRINLPNLPSKPYPKDFEEFKQKYGSKPPLKPGQRV
ncbi:MAG: hypothetical protein M0R50_05935 [Candidatus Cloacimonetes bacterium]|jgi:hypothetical protein|nr:hypothetical protein [Candidatus Cloacimonadota bacterium]